MRVWIQTQAVHGEPKIGRHNKRSASLAEYLELDSVIGRQVQDCGMIIGAISIEKCVGASREVRDREGTHGRTHRKGDGVPQICLKIRAGLWSGEVRILVVQITARMYPWSSCNTNRRAQGVATERVEKCALAGANRPRKCQAASFGTQITGRRVTPSGAFTVCRRVQCEWQGIRSIW